MSTAAKMLPETAMAQPSGGTPIVAPETETGPDTVAKTVPEDRASLEPPATATDKSSVTNIESLPNELLTNIFGYFDTSKPSGSALHDEPTFELTHSEDNDLKAISCVSKRWRRATIPMLFRYARFIVAEPKTQRPILKEVMAPFFDFVKSNSFRKVIASFTFVVHDKKVANTLDGEHRLNSFSEFWYSLFKIIDPLDLLIVAPAEALGALTACHIHMEDAWCFSDCHCHYLQLQRSPNSNLDSSNPEGVAPKEDSTTGETSEVLQPATENLINNTPDVLAHPLEDTGSFYRGENSAPDGNQEHPLQAEASSSASTPSQPRAPARTETSAVFDVRPWTTLLLNEGSSIRAFSTYEFWQRQPPSVSKSALLMIFIYLTAMSDSARLVWQRCTCT
jgi:hypothetical protein